MPPAWTMTRAKLARASRGQSPDPDLIAELRQLFKAQRTEAYLTEVITERPALSAGQLEHLAQLLLTAAVDGDDAA